jgi:non-specific protein-tyrosine kinase
MDLTQSIEKAKLERQKHAGVPAAGIAATVTAQPVEEVEAWHPPAYDESQRVSIDLKHAEKMHLVGLSPDKPESDYYSVTRTQILNMTQEKGWNTIMVTSAQPEEGKTITCINLSLSFAKAYNQTVLLVDNDLRRQNIYRYLGIQSKYGLIDHLTKGIPIGDLIQWPGIEKMVFISGGKTVSSSSELMGSPQMKGMIKEMKSRYPDRYVFFDTPPLLVGADAMTFAPLVDGIAIVVQADKTSREDVQRAMDLIPEEKFLGFILNRERKSSRSNYYYKYYSKK